MTDASATITAQRPARDSRGATRTSGIGSPVGVIVQAAGRGRPIQLEIQITKTELAWSGTRARGSSALATSFPPVRLLPSFSPQLEHAEPLTNLRTADGAELPEFAGSEHVRVDDFVQLKRIKRSCVEISKALAQALQKLDEARFVINHEGLQSDHPSWRPQK